MMTGSSSTDDDGASVGGRGCCLRRDEDGRSGLKGNLIVAPLQDFTVGLLRDVFDDDRESDAIVGDGIVGR